MALPEELEDAFWTEVAGLEEEKGMRYITSIERIGHKRGLEEGAKRGLEEGAKRGLEEGAKKGLEEGVKKGLLEAVRMDLEHHFGAEGLALMPEVQALEDQALIRRVHQALIRGVSLEEVRQIWRG
jgi:flagellar biosynthesis/type III secretory pathway protein FliH